MTHPIRIQYEPDHTSRSFPVLRARSFGLLQSPLSITLHQPGTILHSDRGSQYTSWVVGHRLREAGLLGSMRKVASSVDNGMMESFWSSMQRELLDRHDRDTQAELGAAIFEWIEGFYNPRRRHSALGYRSPAEFEALRTAAIAA